MRAAFFILLLAVGVGAAVAAWHWRNDRVAATARLQHALAGQTASPPPRAAPLPAPAPDPAPATPAKPKTKDPEAARAEYFAAMLPEASEARRAKNPRLAELYRKQLRMEFLLKNGAFLRSRNLPEADRERLLTAWIDREFEMQDARTVGREMGLPISDPALVEGFEAARKRMQETETAVLGPEGIVAMTEYRQGQAIREAVMKLQGEAVLAGYPLTLEQADSVAAILVSSGVRPGRPVRTLSQVDPATAERLLAGVLSPEQRELLLLPLRGSVASSKFSSMVFKIREREASGVSAP
jgi:hypothetical protein